MGNNLSVLLANENSDELDEIYQRLVEENRFESIDKVCTGGDALSALDNKVYDLVITDIVLLGVDGFEVIEKAWQLNKNTKIIVVSALSSEIFIKKATLLGASYYMLKPLNLDVLVKRIFDLFENSVEHSITKTSAGKEVEEKISNIFITVGIPAHIKGYQFLREAIKLAMENPDIINSITKKLYPSIADKFETSASKVERAIRHAIEVAWNRGKIENINSIFGLTVYSNNEKPTNGEFIALVADKMLLDV